MEDVVSDGRRTRQMRFLTTRTPGEEVPRLQPARCERGVLLAALPLDGAGAPPNAPQDPPLGSQRAAGGGRAADARAGHAPLLRPPAPGLASGHLCLHWPGASKGPAHGVVLGYRRLEIHNYLNEGTHIFMFAWGPANYAAGPTQSLQFGALPHGDSFIPPTLQ